MDQRQICPQCGAELPRDAMQGLCPKCMVRVVFGAGETAPLEPAENQVAPIRVELPPDDGLERPGTMIGRYKLLEKIGEGGFGVVYMAEQIEPVRRRVALKVIKAGMDTREVIARFEAERQALALMDHPNIAKILDAGVTGPRSEVRSQRSDVGTATPLTSDLRPLASAPGRPYFVMELVRGIPITEFCDQKQLSPTVRLRLFMKVCQAVQHAHQKAIIHRDIKPSNVLVTLHDGEPVPKVIDFGIAKALGPKLTEKTLFTGFAHLLGTPAYMSPEQAELSGLDIDTRSDIYSLGVLLYELLTGVTPFPKETLAKAALDEIRRMIREVEPPKPSTRLSEQLVAAQLTKRPKQVGKRESENVGANTGSESESHSLTYPPAHSRSVSPQQLQEQRALIQQLRGDLDWIVMKCLEKDRKRRYETANGLAIDLQRHLNHEPVTAAAPSAAYRAQKFIERNKAALSVAASLILLLVAGTIVSTWQAVRATRAEHHAEAEAGKSSQVAQFLKDMLDGVGPSVALGRDTAMLREILDKTAERVGKDLKGQPEADVELRNVMGGVYRDLGLSAQAEAMYRPAVTLAQQAHSPSLMALSLDGLAFTLDGQSRFEEAESLSRQALELQTARFGEQHQDVARSLVTLGIVLEHRAKLTDAEAAHLRALKIHRALFGERHRLVAISHNCLARVLHEQSRLGEAEQHFRTALGIQQQTLGDLHPDTATSLHNLALLLQEEGKLPDAETTHRQAQRLWRQLLPKEHKFLAFSINSLGTVLHDQGKFGEAAAAHREALEMQVKLFGSNHVDVAVSLNNVARVLRALGRPAEAEPLYRQALPTLTEQLGKDHPLVAIGMNNLGRALREQGKLAEAEVLQRDALEVHCGRLGYKCPGVVASLHELALVLREQARLAEAESLHGEALALQRELRGDDHPDLAISLENLSLVLKAGGRQAEAERRIRECLAIREKQIPDNWRTFSARTLLGELLLAQHKNDEAEDWLVSGCEGLRQRETTMSADGRARLKAALEQLVQHFETSGKPERAVEWRRKLAECEHALTPSKSIAPAQL